MANLTILLEIGDILKNLLKDKSTVLSENEINFKSPGEIGTGLQKQLSIFLYKIVENSYLRNTEPKPVGTTKMQYPPLILDLYYILIPYTNNNNKATELIILAEVIQTLYDNQILNIDTENDKIKVVPNSLTLDDLNKLWGIFPEKSYKLSASYILTPVRIPSARDPKDITRVIEKDIKYYSMD